MVPAANHRAAGFTLIELMVVVMLIGLVAAAVVVTMPAANGGAAAQAARFAARAAALRDRSVIEGRAHGLWVSASGYGFERRMGEGWQPYADARLARADWPQGTAISVNGTAQGRLAFDRLGLPDAPMRVEITSGDTQAAVAINSAGEVTVR